KGFDRFIPDEYTTTGYRCNYNGTGGAPCSFKEYNHRVAYAFNSVGGWFYFTQHPTTDNSFILINRKNVKRGNAEPLMTDRPGYEKPHFKVFVGSDGKLNVQFTLVTGGIQTVMTPQAIPLNTRVYLQANNSGIDYEVGWTTLDGTSSRASGSHQGFSVPADIDEHKVARNNNAKCLSGPDIGTPDIHNSGCIKISLLIDENDREGDLDTNAFNMLDLTSFTKKNTMTNFFWNNEIGMFADMNKTDISDRAIYQNNTPLVINAELINKILSDITGGTNYFEADKLRLYVDDNMNVIIVDVRAY
ncbi:hypothetical protein CFT85387_08595, partial [Campylobacter fetus subsp. testudinum]|uniref:hypothetical protein n=1 Tax=Campylobacter fetus TaxID=196 RepID=UPI00082786B1